VAPPARSAGRGVRSSLGCHPLTRRLYPIYGVFFFLVLRKTSFVKMLKQVLRGQSKRIGDPVEASEHRRHINAFGNLFFVPTGRPEIQDVYFIHFVRFEGNFPN